MGQQNQQNRKKQQKQQSAAGLFMSMFLRAIVIIMGIAILAFIIFFITKVVKSGKKADDQPTVDPNVLTAAEAHDELLSNESSTTAETTQEPEEMKMSYDKNILVLNSTDTQGLAGRWCEKLKEKGYVNNHPASYTASTYNTTKVIAKVEGDGVDLVQYFNGAVYEVGDVTEGSDEPTDDYDIIIIIGTSDDDGGAESQ